MKHVRILIVEDDRDLAEKLKERYRAVFSRLGYEPIAIEQAHTAEEAKDLARANTANAYDLVSLDVNLGGRPSAGEAPSTGLDVLPFFRRYKSAWMISLLTGVETDASLNRTVGSDKAELLRKQLRKEAYSKFYPERLMVVEKPSSAEWAADEGKARKLLGDRIEQIALVYVEVARLRYVFRMIEVDGLKRIPTKKGLEKSAVKRTVVPTKTVHWQLRYGCGDLRTLPDKAGFRPVHKLLAMEREESLPPEALIALEPQWKKEKETLAVPTDENPFVTYFKGLGVEWLTLDADKQALLVKATLAAKFSRYDVLRGLEDEDDLSQDEGDELVRLNSDLGPLAELAESRYQRTLSDPHRGVEGDNTGVTEGLLTGKLHFTTGSNYQRREGGRGMDSKEGGNYRQAKKRFLAHLRENGFVEMADHLESSIKSTGSNWSYSPAMAIEWTT